MSLSSSRESDYIDAQDLSRDLSTEPSRPPHQATQGRYKASLLSILIILGGLLFALGAVSARGNVVVQIVCGSLSLSLFGLAAALQMAHGQRLLDSLFAGQLGPWFGASFALVFGLASLGWAAPPTSDATLISKDSVLRAMVVVTVAIGCFTFGYALARRRLVRGEANWLQRVIVTQSPVRDGRRTAWLLFGIALAADLGQIAIGRFGYLSNPAAAVIAGNPFSQFLFVVGNFSVFAVALSANHYAQQRSVKRLWSFAVLLGAQSFIGFFSGEKEVVALGFLAAIMGYAANSRRPPIAGAVAATLIFIFVVVPVTTKYRGLVVVGNSRLSPVQVLQTASNQSLKFFISARQAVAQRVEPPHAHATPALTTAASTTPATATPATATPATASPAPVTPAPVTPTPETPAHATQAAATQTGQRVSRIGDVAIIVQRTKPSDIAYRPLTELLEAPFLGLVPRAIWPGKPILDAGYQFNQQYYGLAATQYTSGAVTPEGDLWRHGGWLVLIAGMLLFGAGVQILDAATIDVRNVPLRLLLILSFFTLVVKHETDVVSLLAAVPSLLFGVALAARIVTTRIHRQSMPVSVA